MADLNAENRTLSVADKALPSRPDRSKHQASGSDARPSVATDGGLAL